MEVFFYRDLAWRTDPNAQSECNTTRRNSFLCYQVVYGDAGAKSYAKAMAYAYYPIYYVNSGHSHCVTKWFNSVFPAINPAGPPIPDDDDSDDDWDDDYGDDDDDPHHHDKDDYPSDSAYLLAFGALTFFL
jgi:hypothetical protein